MGDGGAVGGAQEVHEILTSSERSHRHSSADNFAQRGHVRRHSQSLLGSAGGNSEALHFVEYEDDVKLGGYIAEALEELLLGWQISEGRDHRLHD